MTKRFIYTIFSVCLIFVFTGCGGSQGSDAPELSVITIIPASLTITDATATADWEETSFTIIVKNADGIPLSNVRLNISMPFAWSGLLQTGHLVEMLNNGVRTESPMEAVTQTNGTYVLTLRYQHGGGVAFVSDILVTTGTSSKVATFTVAVS